MRPRNTLQKFHVSLDKFNLLESSVVSKTNLDVKNVRECKKSCLFRSIILEKLLIHFKVHVNWYSVLP